MTTTKARTLRLAPKDVMTGDLLIERDHNGSTVETLVTWLEPKRTNRGATGWSITTVDGARYWYAAQRRLTVKRSGPKGLGEA